MPKKAVLKSLMRHEFYKSVTIDGKQKPVLDFHKLAAEKWPITIIITQRGTAGKSFNMKEYLLDKYEQNGSKAVWIYNSKTQLLKDKRKFLSDVSSVNPKRWERFDTTEHGVFDAIKGENFIYFVYLPRADIYKGARDLRVKNVVYEEFNDSIYARQTWQSENLENLLLTFSNPHGDNLDLKMWLFGNQKSVGVPLLADLGIFKIDKELTIFKDLILIYTPKHDLKALKTYFSRNWVYKFSQMLGLEESSFGNVNLADDFAGILHDFSPPQDFSIGFCKVEGRFFQIFEIGKYLFFSWARDKKQIDKSNCVYFLRQDAEYGIAQNPDFAMEIKSRIEHELIAFDSVISKLLISRV